MERETEIGDKDQMIFNCAAKGGQVVDKDGVIRALELLFHFYTEVTGDKIAAKKVTEELSKKFFEGDRKEQIKYGRLIVDIYMGVFGGASVARFGSEEPAD